MSNEPERNVEKLLRTYAKKRRDDAGASLDLHPADRRRLQEEVARRRKDVRREGNFFSTALAALRPRWAFVVSTAVVLLIGTVLLFPTFRTDRQTMQFAHQDAEIQLAKQTALPPPGSSAPKTLTLTESELDRPTPALDVGAKDDSRSVLDQVATKKPTLVGSGGKGGREGAADGFVNGPVTAASGIASDSLRSEEGNREAKLALAEPAQQRGVAQKSEIAAALPVTTVAEASTDRGQPSEAASSQNGVSRSFKNPATQRFAQVARADLQQDRLLAVRARPAATILTSFQIEQNGDQLRFIDNDGSVYTGSVQLASVVEPVPAAGGGGGRGRLAPISDSQTEAADESRAKPVVQPQPAATLARRQNVQGVRFRAEGTNRTSNQKVVLDGSFLTVANATTFGLASTNMSKQTTGTVTTPSAGFAPLPLSNLRVTGWARIGEGDELEINAEPVSP